MHSDHPEIRTHHRKPAVERFNGFLGKLMIAAVLVAAVGLVYGLITSDTAPSWMQ